MNFGHTQLAFRVIKSDGVNCTATGADSIIVTVSKRAGTVALTSGHCCSVCKSHSELADRLQGLRQSKTTDSHLHVCTCPCTQN